jgi:hypothetical protein
MTESALSRARIRNGRVKTIADLMSETELDAAIERIVADLNRSGFVIRSFHPYDSRKSREGWLDRAYISVRGQMFRELKDQRRKLTPEQSETLMLLQAGGADADVYRPADLLSGRIGTELSILAGAGLADPEACLGWPSRATWRAIAPVLTRFSVSGFEGEHASGEWPVHIRCRQCGETEDAGVNDDGDRSAGLDELAGLARMHQCPQDETQILGQEIA